jgi:hypothetical protein
MVKRVERLRKTAGKAAENSSQITNMPLIIIILINREGSDEEVIK